MSRYEIYYSTAECVDKNDRSKVIMKSEYRVKHIYDKVTKTFTHEKGTYEALAEELKKLDIKPKLVL